jgi:hypothetical protein
MYDATGAPVWYVAGPISNSTQATDLQQPRQRYCNVGPPPLPPYISEWVQFANGQSIGAPYRSPVVANAEVGSMNLLIYSGADFIILTLPNGVQDELQRFMP